MIESIANHIIPLSGFSGGAAGSSAGVRGGGVPVQAAPGGAGAHQPADPGVLRLREPLHAVHHGDPQGRLGAARHLRQQDHQRGREPGMHVCMEGFHS